MIIFDLYFFFLNLHLNFRLNAVETADKEKMLNEVDKFCESTGYIYKYVRNKTKNKIVMKFRCSHLKFYESENGILIPRNSKTSLLEKIKTKNDEKNSITTNSLTNKNSLLKTTGLEYSSTMTRSKSRSIGQDSFLESLMEKTKKHISEFTQESLFSQKKCFSPKSINKIDVSENNIFYFSNNESNSNGSNKSKKSNNQKEILDTQKSHSFQSSGKSHIHKENKTKNKRKMNKENPEKNKYDENSNTKTNDTNLMDNNHKHGCSAFFKIEKKQNEDFFKFVFDESSLYHIHSPIQVRY